MIVEVDEWNENKNIISQLESKYESQTYQDRKKNILSALETCYKNKIRSDNSISYDPSLVIQKKNKEKNLFDENEKNVFKFLDEYCEINKEIDELSDMVNFSDEMPDNVTQDEKENNQRVLNQNFPQNLMDIKMRNTLLINYDEEVDPNEVDVNMNSVENYDELHDETKFRKSRNNKNIKKKRKIIEE